MRRMDVRMLVAWWVLMLAVAMPALAADLPLVKDRQPQAQVILKSDAAYMEIFAGRELQFWIGKISGAKLPLQSTPDAIHPTRIFIGQAFAGDFKEDLAKLQGNDGYAIRTRGNDVFVFGSLPRGTFYGVMALLQKNTDIIFARPNVQFGTIHGDHPTITLTQADVLDIPVFPYRGLNGGHPPQQATELWRLRNGDNLANRGLTAAKWNLPSFASEDLSSPLWDQYDKHPEYFGYDPLQRKRVKPGYFSGALCLTHPHLGTIWAKAIVEHIHKLEAQRGRPLELMRITPGDNWGVCHCPQCLKPITLPDGRVIVAKSPDAVKDPYFRSTQVVMLLNEAMETLSREAPHVKFLVLAYIHLAEPPAVPLDKRYLVYFAPYPTNSMHYPLLDPRQSAVWRNRFTAWLEMSPHLGFFEYFYGKPDPIGYYAAANLRALAAPGRDTSGSLIYAEFENDSSFGGSAAGWDMGAMNHWVLTRLFWNPHQDVDELYREFIRRTYREAAPTMIEHFEMIRDSWLDPANKTIQAAHAGATGIYNGLVVDRGLEKKSTDLLAKALAQTSHPGSRMFIQRLARQYSRMGQSLNRLMVHDIPEMSIDGMEFHSLQWEKPEMLEGFMEERRYGSAVRPEQETGVKAAHDGKLLYVRFYARDTQIGQAVARPRDDQETWPAGDHGELWFKAGNQTFLFAFDCHGNAYDARSLDRDWQSGWQVRTQKTEEGWEAIVAIPLQALGLVPGEESKVTWMIRREINHGRDRPQWVSYSGAVLHRHFFPLVMP